MAKDVYRKIAEKMGAPPTKRFLTLLEADFSPEEGEVLLELFVPTTAPEVAARLKADEKKVTKMLDAMADRGLINKGKTQYCFHNSIMAYHHHTVGGRAVEPVPQKVKDAWGDFFRAEWSDIIVDGYEKHQTATGRPVFRVWPAIGALELSSNIKPEQILPEEDFRFALENKKRIIVGHCGCRKNWATCDHSLETCFAPSDGPRALSFVFDPKRPGTREVTLKEALEIVHRNEAEGLVHTGACYCCDCCCEILFSLTKTQRYDLLGASRYRARVNEDKCIGCQTCIERCPFNAIEMRKVAGSKKLKAFVDEEACKGCGVCVVGCEQRALRYELVKPPEYIYRPPLKPGASPGVQCACDKVDR